MRESAVNPADQQAFDDALIGALAALIADGAVRRIKTSSQNEERRGPAKGAASFRSLDHGNGITADEAEQPATLQPPRPLGPPISRRQLRVQVQPHSG